MSNIEWTEQTWNPVVGCTPVSAGCLNCYAATMATRLGAMPSRQGVSHYVGLTTKVTDAHGDTRSIYNGTVRCVEDALTVPLRRKKPTTYFVCSMSDLFHASVPDAFIDRVFAVMALCPQHTFQVLTKRPERMAEYLNRQTERFRETGRCIVLGGVLHPGTRLALTPWPLPNVWLGTSAEDQAALERRVRHLWKCPAVVRFLSCEPLLEELPWLGTLIAPKLECHCGTMWTGGIGGPLDACPGCRDFVERDRPRVDWVIVGGESGAHARPCYVEWVRDVVVQCRVAGVPVFVKQLGSDPCRAPELGTFPMKLNDPKGGDMAEWPEDLRVREMPKVGAAPK